MDNDTFFKPLSVQLHLIKGFSRHGSEVSVGGFDHLSWKDKR